MTSHRHLGTLRPLEPPAPEIGWQVLPTHTGIAIPVRPIFAATADLVAAGVSPAVGVRCRYDIRRGDDRSDRAFNIEAA